MTAEVCHQMPGPGPKPGDAYPPADARPPGTEDAVLIAAVRDGDRDALDALYRRYRADALIFAWRMTRNDQDAEDIMQEAFMKTINAINNGYGPADHFRAYLNAAVRTAASQCWQHRLREVPAGKGPADKIPAYDDRLDNVLDTAENKRVLAAFGTLNGRWQKVLWYTDVLQEPPRRIAPVMGIAPNAVSALIQRARKALRAAYEDSLRTSPAP